MSAPKRKGGFDFLRYVKDWKDFFCANGVSYAIDCINN